MYKKGDIVQFHFDRGSGIFENHIGKIVIVDSWQEEETSYDIETADPNGNKFWCKHVLEKYIKKTL